MKIPFKGPLKAFRPFQGHGDHFKGGRGDPCKITGAVSKNKENQREPKNNYTLVAKDPKQRGSIGSLGAYSLGAYSRGLAIVGKVAHSLDWGPTI